MTSDESAQNDGMTPVGRPSVFRRQIAALSIVAKKTHAAYGANSKADTACRGHDKAMNAMIVASRMSTNNTGQAI